MSKMPTFAYERRLITQGFKVIVGVDEVGCGALAGPVCAGAVVLPLDSRLGAIRDSKLVGPQERERLYARIVERADAWSVGYADVQEIATLNIRGATFLAMRRAVEQIPQAQVLLIDAWRIPGVDLPQQAIIHGDLLVKSIAAASLIAKVSRDRVMQSYHEQYPQYGFPIHKGYATALHKKAIAIHGPCLIHRLGFRTFSS
ncbi:ribonuclease HII [Candidatus Uhrbacteria bacterium]|nr:ribonuclease HII [Candidatus Uhrbacteria bacterium]